MANDYWASDFWNSDFWAEDYWAKYVEAIGIFQKITGGE